jgi:transcription elongation factor GreA
MLKKINLTPEGLTEKQDELTALQTDRVDAIKELTRAREMGDLSENAAYKVARSRVSRIDSRIRFLVKLLKQVQVVTKRTDGRIGLGNVVTIDDGIAPKIITLVDGYESDFMRGKISGFSPIGRALMGKRVGDSVEVSTPKGTSRYQVTDFR